MPLKCRRVISRFPIKLYSVQFLSVSIAWHNLIFRAFTFVRGDTSPDPEATDGQLFVKKVVNGEKISERPEYLLFTAPYKLCEGGCNESVHNIALSFPLYIGKRAKTVYRSLYPRDAKKIHGERPNAPFVKKTTRVPFTTCRTAIETTTESTTESTTEPTIEEYVTVPSIVPTEAIKAVKSCPPFKRACIPKKKTATNKAALYAITDETDILYASIDDEIPNYPDDENENEENQN